MTWRQNSACTLSIEDCRSERQRAKVEEFERHLFVIANNVHFAAEKQECFFGEIDFFVSYLAQRIAGFPAETIAAAKQAASMGEAGMEDELAREETIFLESAQSGPARPRMAAYVILNTSTEKKNGQDDFGNAGTNLQLLTERDICGLSANISRAIPSGQESLRDPKTTLTPAPKLISWEDKINF